MAALDSSEVWTSGDFSRIKLQAFHTSTSSTGTPRTELPRTLSISVRKGYWGISLASSILVIIVPVTACESSSSAST